MLLLVWVGIAFITLIYRLQNLQLLLLLFLILPHAVLTGDPTVLSVHRQQYDRQPNLEMVWSVLFILSKCSV